MNEQEQKELLIALCGYLPYGVMFRNEKYNRDELLITISSENTNSIVSGSFVDGNVVCSSFIEDLNIKPYLRPMESMTDEERKELMDLCDITPYETQGLKIDEYGAGVFLNGICSVNSDVFDWLNDHHFDYRGLIPKGLALPAPDGMYDTYKYFPPEFKTYTEYVEHLKSKGLAFDAPDGK